MYLYPWNPLQGIGWSSLLNFPERETKLPSHAAPFVVQLNFFGPIEEIVIQPMILPL